MKESVPYFILTVAVFLWCGMLVVPPWIASIEQQPAVISRSLYNAYASICHQYDSRSLHIFGHKLAVCARCSGIYLGFFIGCALKTFILKNYTARGMRVWLIAGFPVLADVLLDLSGVHQSSAVTRVCTGLFFGAGAAVNLAPFITEGIKEIMSKKPTIQGVTNESKTR